MKPLIGKSFIPELKNQTGKEHKELFFQFVGNHAIRTKNWKLVRTGNKSYWELYNPLDDRAEENNLALKKPEIVKSLDQKWNNWFKSTTELTYSEYKSIRAKNKAKRKSKKKN